MSVKYTTIEQVSNAVDEHIKEAQNIKDSVDALKNVLSSLISETPAPSSSETQAQSPLSPSS